ncbi:MAG: MBL fold metallo-hydrolase [Aestuariibacter sp.]
MKKTLFSLAIALSLPLSAHDRFGDVEIKTQAVSESVYMLTGMGGNIGISIGDDGVLIIDDQFEPLAVKITEAIKAISDSKIKYVVNTHYHGDHTGANAWFKKVEDATIFAHDNVRHRLQQDEKMDAAGWPVVTYEQGVKFHFNGDTIHVRHRPNSHTDGDSFVLFEQQNVIHAGDLLFNKLFPYIDLDAGGTIAGYMGSLQAMIDASDDETKIIAGHGEMASKADLKTNLHMLKSTAAAVKTMKDSGMSLEACVEKGLDEEWASWSWSFIDSERWISTLYKGQ